MINKELRRSIEAKPFFVSELQPESRVMSESDSGESGGGGSCGDSACACPSEYVPIDAQVK